jgi:hypothetical protein
VVHDIFGGEILAADVLREGERVEAHMWNRLPGGLELDLTRDQFRNGEEIGEASVRRRPEQFDPEHPRYHRYEAYLVLAQRVQALFPASRERRPIGRTIRFVRSRLLIALGLLGCALAFTASASPKPRAGIPTWLGARETQTLATVFGNPRLVQSWHIPYRRKIAVVWEFQSVTVCRTCSAPSNTARPRGRAVRVSFDRRTRRLNDEMRFCEVRGTTPPLSVCLAR